MKINISIGTAAVLGLARTSMLAAPTTAYLMLGGRCLMNCAFCTQARDSQAGAQHLSRVTWPAFDLDVVVPRLVEVVSQGTIRRTCVQVTVGDDSLDASLHVLRTVKAACDVPFDVAILPRDLDQVRQLVDAGADHIGFGLDAATEAVFRQVKGGSWRRHLDLIAETARWLPGRAALHLIVGLGETEQEMVERVQWAHDLGITVGLFAFTPVRGTHLADRPPPPLATYRRMQMARWLIVHDLARAGGMAFDTAGTLVDFGCSLPVGGQAFQTSGCPDCNRPFYNEQPGGPMYNYPRPLAPAEVALVISEMEVGPNV